MTTLRAVRVEEKKASLSIRQNYIRVYVFVLRSRMMLRVLYCNTKVSLSTEYHRRGATNLLFRRRARLSWAEWRRAK
jgi:hypothetical protein